MTDFNISKQGKLPKMTKPIAIEGLPGIANVGKIAVDYLVKNIKAKPFLSLNSEYFPSTVYVGENNSIQKAGVEFNHIRIKKQDFIFITGNSQPSSEPYSYRFAKTILSWLKEHGCHSIITTGGIGLIYLPEKPKVYCAGNDKKFVKEFEKFKVKTEVYGKVGSISGATGLLLSLADGYNISAVTLLGETLAHPLHVGINSAKALVTLLNSKYNLGLKKEDIDKDFKETMQEIDISDVQPKTKSGKAIQPQDVNYIG
jgi:hypothetical protein